MASSQFCVFISLMRPHVFTTLRRKWLLFADPESTSVRGDQPGGNGCCVQTLRAHLSEETSQEEMRLCRPWEHICQRRPARRKWLLFADPESTSVRGDRPGGNGCCLQTLRAHLSEETSQEEMAAVCRPWEHICQRRPARRKWLLCADPESTSVREDQPGENETLCRPWEHICQRRPARRKWLLFADPEHICQRRPARRKWGISRLARPAFHINHSCGYFWLHACGNFILPLYINIVGIHSTGLLLMLFLRPAYVNRFITSVLFINYLLLSLGFVTGLL